MMSNKSLFLFSSAFILCAVGALCATWPAAGSLDGIAYMQAARHIAQGDFHLGLTRWWGMLSEIIMSVLVLAGLTPLLSSKVLMLVLCPFYAFGIRELCRSFGVERACKAVFVACALIYVQVVVSGYFTDILFSAIFIFYFTKSVSILRKPLELKDGCCLAGLGALLYYTKHFGFPYVVAHLMTLGLVSFFTVNKTQPFRVLVLIFGLTIFVVPHIIMTNAGADRFSIGSSTYQSAWSAKGMPPPHQHFGIDEGLREGRLIGWENPEEMKRNWELWKATDSAESMQYQFRVWIRNIRKSIGLLLRQTGSILLVVFVFMAFYPQRVIETARSQWASLLFVVASASILIGAYSLNVVDDRYLFPIQPLLFGGAAILLRDMRRFEMFRRHKAVLTVVMLVGFLCSPLVTLSKDVASARSRPHRRLYEFAKHIPRENRPTSLASSPLWRHGANFAFFAEIPYAGCIYDYEDTEKLLDVLRQHSVTGWLYMETPNCSRHAELLNNPSFELIESYKNCSFWKVVY